LERYRTVMEDTLNLTEAMGEGIEYIRHHVAREDYYLDTLNVFNEILAASAAIETHFQLFSDKLPGNQIEECMVKLQAGFASLALAYEQGTSDRLLQVVQSLVNPAFELWKKELYKMLSPYTTL
jgi:hypothetical protein